MDITTANRLYELRKQHGYSQDELADKLNVSRQAISKWERSESSPDTDNLIALAKLYGVSLDELLNYTPSKASDKQEENDASAQDDAQNDGFTQNAQSTVNNDENATSSADFVTKCVAYISTKRASTFTTRTARTCISAAESQNSSTKS